MNRVVTKINDAFLVVAGILFALIAIIILSQVGANLLNRGGTILLGRSLGLNVPSYSDFVGVFVICAASLGLAGTLERGGHIRVNLLLGRLRGRSRRYVELLCVLLVSVTSLGMFYAFARMTIEAWAYADVTQGQIPIQLWIPHLIVTIGFAQLVLTVLASLLSDGFEVERQR